MPLKVGTDVRRLEAGTLADSNREELACSHEAVDAPAGNPESARYVRDREEVY